MGRQPILKDKTSEKNRIKIQKKGKPVKKVFSFFDTKLVEKRRKMRIKMLHFGENLKNEIEKRPCYFP